MKFRLKGVAGVKKLSPGKLYLVLEEPSELLMYLIGRQAMTGEKITQAFSNLKLSNSADVLEFWIVAGMIVGTPTNWSLSPMFKSTVLSNFGKQLTSMKQASSPVPLYVLVGRYKKLLKSVKRQNQPTGNIVARFRLICRQFPSNSVMEQLEEFFKHRSWPDYSLDQFQKFLTLQKKSGRLSPL